MSSIKKVTSPIFYTVTFIAILMFSYEFLVRHFPDGIAKIVPSKKSVVQTQDVSPVSTPEQSTEIAALTEKVHAHEVEIAKLNEALTNLSYNAANSEKYSKFFLILSNLNSILKNDNEVNVAFEIKALQNFAVNDVRLTQILHNVNEMETVEGTRYFVHRFGYVVRKIMKKHYQNTTDNPVIAYIKTHVMPYFAYISPESNNLSYILYQAHQQLEFQNMEGVYKILLTIKSDDEHFKDFMLKLEQHVRLTSTMSESKKCIETMLIA